MFFLRCEEKNFLTFSYAVRIISINKSTDTVLTGSSKGNPP